MPDCTLLKGIPIGISDFRKLINEFKVSGVDNNESMAVKAREALEQMERKDYREELVQAGIREVVELAIVFYHKKVYMEYRLV